LLQKTSVAILHLTNTAKTSRWPRAESLQ